MAEEQIIVSIKVEDKEIKQAALNIDTLTDSIEELGSEIKETSAKNKEYKKIQEEINKELKAGNITVKQRDEGIKKLNEEISVNNRKIAETRVELTKQKAERTANIKLVNTEIGSLEQLDAQASVLLKQIKKQTTATKEGREEYARLEEQLAAVNKQANDQRQVFNDNTRNIGNYADSLREAADETKDFDLRTADLVEVINRDVAALKSQEKQLQENIETLKKAQKATSLSEDDQKALTAEIARYESELESVNSELQMYGENIVTTEKKTGIFKKSVKALGGGLKAVTKGGLKVFSNGLKAIGKIGIFAVISAIVSVFALLGKAFSRSANGSKVFTKVLAVLEGLFSVLITVMNKFAGEAIKAFEDPKKAVTELWTTIKTGLLDRLNGAVELFGAFGEKLKAMWSGTAEESAAASQKINDSLKKIAFGETDDNAKSFIDTIKEASKQAENLAAKFLNLEAAQRKQRESARGLQKDISVLQAEFDLLGEVLGDDTTNMQDMEAATVKALEVGVKLAAKQAEFAKSRLNIINQEIALRRSTGEEIQDLLDQQAAAEVELMQARSDATIAQKKISIEQAKVQRDIFEQNLDILLDVGDKIKTVQEKQITNEAFSLEKRKGLLEASKAAVAANFEEIKKEYELYGVTAEQINEVINASDAKQANEKLKALGLNEIANNRLREIILERKQVELDFNDLANDLSQEEIDRKQKAAEKVGEIEKDAALAAADTQAEKNELLREIEMERIETLLEDETLLNEEKAALILEHEANLREISQEAKANEIEDTQVFLDTLAGISEEFGGAETAIFARVAAGIAGAFEDGKVSATSALNALAMVSDAIFAKINADIEASLQKNSDARDAELLKSEQTAFAEVNVLKNQRAAEERAELETQAAAGDRDAQFKLAELKAQENAEAAALEINKEFDRKQAALKLKQFNADKKAAIIQIAIQTALAAIKTAGTMGFPAAIPFIVLTAALGVASIAVVASKKAPQFAKGTSDIVNIGGSHASGNDVDVWGYSGNQKQHFGKVEKGEAMPVIKKSAVNAYQVQKLNGAFSPRNSRTFAQGTPDISNNSNAGGDETAVLQARDNEQLATILTNALMDVKIVAFIEDITKAAGKKIEIESNSQF